MRIDELDTKYSTEITLGSSGPEVVTIQYYLAYISLFVPTVLSPTVDGSFGEGTRDAVISFQKTYGLNQTGAVDEVTWNKIESTYYEMLSKGTYLFEPGLILPYPGRVLRVGVNGNDVLALQEYLNYISNTYPEIPKVNADGDFGPATARAVRRFIELFDIPGNPERVTATVWNAIINVYDDLYVGNFVNENQFPGIV